ncbi:MAG TPA: hypothetical protein VKH44_06975 [Pirellulaceae bacterium]|nr:hypothetical protein [Pirellulaceae bacterium]
MLRAFVRIESLSGLRSFLAALGACLMAAWVATAAVAAPPWATLVPFKKIDADPSKNYELEEKHGPWMIMAASFAGATAEQQSHDLVLELRQRFKLEAYIFRRTYDFSKPTDGLGYSRYGGPRRMKYMNSHKFEEIAVLVGNFASIEDPQMDKALALLKSAKPESLDPSKKPDSSQRLAGLRTLYSMMSSNPAARSKGPMGASFVTRNPLLPEELFVAKGLDPFVYDMNKDLPHSLLKCPGRYTVRVGSFRGVDTMKPAEFDRLTTQQRKISKIDQAALNASRLCAALREKGVEAYEFHDRTESYVTIGSFNDVGQPRADGKIEINPAVHRVMQEYGPVEQPKAGTDQVELYARVEKASGIRFDPQPMPVEVPRQSIAASYNATNSLLK